MSDEPEHGWTRVHLEVDIPDWMVAYYNWMNPGDPHPFTAETLADMFIENMVANGYDTARDDGWDPYLGAPPDHTYAEMVDPPTEGT